MTALALSAAWVGLACSGGTEGPTTSGPGPGSVESPSPVVSSAECLSCSDVLDAVSTGPLDAEICEESEELLEAMGECACGACAVTCAGVCGAGGSVSSSCWSCVSVSCGAVLSACRAD